MKYGGRTRLVPFLGELLADALVRRPLEVDLVVPVPLTRARIAARGFNQAELLARPLAAARGWTLEPGALVRARETAQQTRLPARARRANVAGAFAVRIPALVRDRRVLLVDDVCTTGATLEACAAPLVAAGAAGVWAIVVAREVCDILSRLRTEFGGRAPVRNLSIWQAVAIATELGVAFAVAVLIGLLVGHVIDSKLGLEFPIFMGLGALVGLASGVYSATQFVRFATRPRKE